MSNIQSYPFTPPTSPKFHPIVPPENILWLSFDPVTTSFASLLSKWPGGSVTSYSFETDVTHHHISYLMSSATSSTYTTLSHLLFHLRLLKGLPCKPFTMIDATQACKSIAMNDATQACKRLSMNDASQACKRLAMNDASQACKRLAMNDAP